MQKATHTYSTNITAEYKRGKTAEIEFFIVS